MNWGMTGTMVAKTDPQLMQVAPGYHSISKQGEAIRCRGMKTDYKP